MEYTNAGDNRGERGPRFMAQDGHELVLRLVGRLSFLLARRQLNTLALALLNQSAVCRADPSDQAVHDDIDHQTCQIHTVSDQEEPGRG